MVEHIPPGLVTTLNIKAVQRAIGNNLRRLQAVFRQPRHKGEVRVSATLLLCGYLFWPLVIGSVKIKHGSPLNGQQLIFPSTWRTSCTTCI